MKRETLIFQNSIRLARIKETMVWTKGTVYTPHLHSEIELLYIESGSLVCTVDNSDYTLNSGEILFINSNHPHSTKILESKTAYKLIHMPAISITNNYQYVSFFLTQVSVSGYLFKKADSDYVSMRNYFLNIIKIINEAKDDEISSDCTVAANVYMILSLLYKKQILPPKNDNIDFSLLDKISPVLDYIENNYHEKIYVEDLAKIIKLNTNYFCRIFQKATRTTTSDYINYVRICKATDLLNTDMNITEISNRVGFSSLSHFNKTFKKYKFYSPTEYKKVFKPGF